MLDYTPKEIVERKALTINPAKICQPIGAVLAAKGIHNCMPLTHGSQGCSSYLRMALARHYREPSIAATSSFTEDSVVFGGRENLREAVENVIKLYHPDVIAISTTCSAETIGDDVYSFMEEIKGEEFFDPKIKVIISNTPSYVGSHITGYDNVVKSIAETFPKKRTPNGKLNIIPGFIEPGDIREIKRILNMMGVSYIVFPDTTDVFDAPLKPGSGGIYPPGGTTIPDLEDIANSVATIALGRCAGGSGAMVLKSRFGVPAVIGPTPIGITNTDKFVMTVSDLMGVPIPQELEDERGRLVDMMTDAHPHFHGKKVAVFGDPDVVVGIVGLLADMGMEPVFALTGTPDKQFISEVNKIAPDCEAIIGDLFLLHQKIKNRPVDLLMGNTYGKYIARAEDIPFIRIGFPIFDRANLHFFPIVGYMGAARLVERIGNTLLDRVDRDAYDSYFELIL
ncbi:nitrogenase molybdenum-iron protein subunit beta [Caldanaerobius polysaccharolyticus]|uniref:nitrogenase molybdenum-iron protein subunit beta n=1 Tax=Caldanaerobius polysaccharolyticus TaxID=44256 RepID=UPI000479D3F9|nr:nitrogenase molybdenum-iron protein subunit beta [Caldanaerobius polysaccharolyticus]